MLYLRRFLVLVVIASIDAYVLWVFFAARPMRGTLEALAALPFFVGPIGGLWMAYDCIRHERHPWPYAVLSVVPYAFVWHYFERVKAREGQATTRS